MDNWDNNYEQREPNFVMVGEPSSKTETEPAPSPEPAPQAGHTGQTVYTGPTVHTEQTGYTRQGEQGNPYSENNSYTYYQQTPPVPPKKKKKEPKYITRRAFVITLICCMLATSGLTIGGYTLLSDNGIISGGGKTVSATNYTLAKATGSEKSVQEIIAQNENAVVEIRTESVSMDNWLQNYVTQGAGSGVIVDTKGYILTCNHVIDGASKITVTLKDGTELEAKVVGGDSQNDVAVLKVNAKNLTAATYGDSGKLSVGDMVVAIGNPLGQLGGSASSGIISALDRTITVEGREMTLLQTDTSINPGNSGGGLFDQYGNLIGIVVAKSSGSDVEGLGFAIPIAKAAEIAKDLIENGHVTNRVAIGISVLDASSAEVAMQYGLRITGVYVQEVTGDEAKKAGFKAGDMIYYVEDTKIENQASLVSALNKHKPGDKIKVTVIRENQTVEITTTLIEATE